MIFLLTGGCLNEMDKGGSKGGRETIERESNELARIFAGKGIWLKPWPATSSF